MYNGAGNDPTLELQFKPLPNKKYLIDAGMYGTAGNEGNDPGTAAKSRNSRPKADARIFWFQCLPQREFQ